ncbi:hypothetical protein [Brevibacillus gelatini]
MKVELRKYVKWFNETRTQSKVSKYTSLQTEDT